MLHRVHSSALREGDARRFVRRRLPTMSDFEFETVQPTDVPEGAQLIDIREPDEYDQWHAEGAENLPLSQLQQRYGEFDLDRDIYLICLSGGRSARACQWLEMNGIDAINVANGTAGWRDAGLPIVGQE
jgi:rhodanese-related sulfurtransferase